MFDELDRLTYELRDVSKRVKAKEVSSVSEISAKMDKTQPAPVEALYGDR
jgi:hypothetical protein